MAVSSAAASECSACQWRADRASPSPSQSANLLAGATAAGNCCVHWRTTRLKIVGVGSSSTSTSQLNIDAKCLGGGGRQQRRSLDELKVVRSCAIELARKRHQPPVQNNRLACDTEEAEQLQLQQQRFKANSISACAPLVSASACPTTTATTTTAAAASPRRWPHRLGRRCTMCGELASGGGSLVRPSPKAQPCVRVLDWTIDGESSAPKLSDEDEDEDEAADEPSGENEDERLSCGANERTHYANKCEPPTTMAPTVATNNNNDQPKDRLKKPADFWLLRPPPPTGTFGQASSCRLRRRARAKRASVVAAAGCCCSAGSGCCIAAAPPVACLLGGRRRHSWICR